MYWSFAIHDISVPSCCFAVSENKNVGTAFIIFRSKSTVLNLFRYSVNKTSVRFDPNVSVEPTPSAP